MDDIVHQAMVKWPNVPDCYGWLGLDGRGQWCLRDDAAQAAGPFASGRPGARGSVLLHEKLLGFIARNYAADALGRWYFQNGPQRVYVELQHTPWIWRVDASGAVTSHTGVPAAVYASYLDEAGLLYLHAALGFGLVHTADMERAATQVEQGLWVPEEVQASTLPVRFGYVISPQQGARGDGIAIK